MIYPEKSGEQAPGDGHGEPPPAGAEERCRELIGAGRRLPGAGLAVKIGDIILEEAVRSRASDVHIERQGSGFKVRFRVDGLLRDALKLPASGGVPLVERLRLLAGLQPEPPENFRREEGGFEKLMDGRAFIFRVSYNPTVDGGKLVIRLLCRQEPGLRFEQLGLDRERLDAVRGLMRSPSGLFFVTGPAGAGATTSLYALLAELNTPERSISTLEDPVEYRLEGVNQARIDTRTGYTWAEAMGTLTRQDSEVIMVSGIRDHECAEVCVRAAMGGRLVLTTVQSVSPAGVIECLFALGIPPFQLGPALLGAMNQRLVRKLCPQCSRKAAPPPEPEVRRLVAEMDPEEARLVEELLLKPGADYKAEKGCAACRGTGYAGRTGIFELLPVNGKVRKLILERAPEDAATREAILAGGMRTLLMDGILKARAGITTLAEVIRVAARTA